MRRVCVFVLTVAALNQVACGGSKFERALAETAAYTAIEVAAAAIEQAQDEARARDAAKKESISGRANRSPNGRWELARNAKVDPCDAPISQAQREDCEANSAGDDVSVIETEEVGVSVGQCMVCE